MSAHAISVMGMLAASQKRRLGSGEIARDRNISQALTSKLLAQLATGGLVDGRPGPGGGYKLAKSPSVICLLDIIMIFENMSGSNKCPLGNDCCDEDNPCPLRKPLSEMNNENRKFLEATRLSVFSE